MMLKHFVTMLCGVVLIFYSTATASGQRSDAILGLHGGDAYLEEIDSYLYDIEQRLDALLRVGQALNSSSGETDWSYRQVACQTDLGEISYEMGLRVIGVMYRSRQDALKCRTGTSGTPYTNRFQAWSAVSMEDMDFRVDISFISLGSSADKGVVNIFLHPNVHFHLTRLLEQLGAPSIEHYKREVRELKLTIGLLDEVKDQPCVVIGLIGASGDPMVEYNFVGTNSDDFCLSVFPNRYEETAQFNVYGELERNIVLLAAARVSKRQGIGGDIGLIYRDAQNVRSSSSHQSRGSSDQYDHVVQPPSFLSRLFDGFGNASSDPIGPSQEEIIFALYGVPEARELFRVTLQDTNTYCENSRDCIVEARYVIGLLPRTKDAFVSTYMRVLSALGASQFELRMLEASFQTALMFGDYPNNVLNIIPHLGSSQHDIMRFVKGQGGWIYLAEENQNTSSPSQPYKNPLQGWLDEHGANSFR